MKKPLPASTLEWLLSEGSPAVRFNARILMGQKDPDRGELLSDPLVKEAIGLLKAWDDEVLEQHNKPSLLMHRLALLADLGLRATDPGIAPIFKKVLKRADEEGRPESIISIPKVFGGSNAPLKAWIICDFPLILYSLSAMGVADEAVSRGMKSLETMASENGYRCLSSMEKFHGPGRRDDFCPIACLYALRALASSTGESARSSALKAANALLGHWEERGAKKHYLFGIGTDFMKLKYPLVWYNLLHVLDAISRIPALARDPRAGEMCDALMAKADPGLRFKAESVYLIYKGRDFADKKAYSPSITLCALGILHRMGRIRLPST